MTGTLVTNGKLPVSCNRDCGAGCPLVASIEGGRVVRVSDNPLRPPGMRGCARGYRSPRVLYHPERLTLPLRRVGPRGSGRFQEISWNEALERVSGRLEDVRARHGPQAVLRLGGSGSCRGALHNTSQLTQRFLSLFGGFTGSYDSYSSAAESFVIPHVFGTPEIGVDPDTLAESRLVILWGANVVDTRFGCLLEGRLKALRRKGTPIVVVDPRRSRTVEHLADRWVPLRPGTDAALMAGVLHELLARGAVDREVAARVSAGFDALEGSILGTGGGEPKSPEWAEALCGTPARSIREFAALYGSCKPAALISGLSIQRTLGGEEAVRMAVALQVATANLGIPGRGSRHEHLGQAAFAPLRPDGGAGAPPRPGSRCTTGPTRSWKDGPGATRRTSGRCTTWEAITSAPAAMWPRTFVHSKLWSWLFVTSCS